MICSLLCGGRALGSQGGNRAEPVALYWNRIHGLLKCERFNKVRCLCTLRGVCVYWAISLFTQFNHGDESTLWFRVCSCTTDHESSVQEVHRDVVPGLYIFLYSLMSHDWDIVYVSSITNPQWCLSVVRRTVTFHLMAAGAEVLTLTHTHTHSRINSHMKSYTKTHWGDENKIIWQLSSPSS